MKPLNRPRNESQKTQQITLLDQSIGSKKSVTFDEIVQNAGNGKPFVASLVQPPPFQAKRNSMMNNNMTDEGLKLKIGQNNQDFAKILQSRNN